MKRNICIMIIGSMIMLMVMGCTTMGGVAGTNPWKSDLYEELKGDKK